MEELLNNLSIKVNEKIYLKDPESSELGKKIISGGIDLINELGFEAFTFKKLAIKIESTEASVYRYFESKHNFLLYLISWYWGWLEYRLVISTHNIKDPYEKLEKSIEILTEKVQIESKNKHINESKLYEIIISESFKAYFTKLVDRENKDGIYSVYKKIVNRVSAFILEINPNFSYPHAMVSTVIEGAKQQHFFKVHLPKITDYEDGKSITDFFKKVVINTIKE